MRMPPYCHLWSVTLYYISTYYLINGKIFGKKKELFNTKLVFWFYLQLLSETFLILTLDDGLLARSQYPEGPATGHHDTGFS